MNQYRKANVVMLPTTKESRLQLFGTSHLALYDNVQLWNKNGYQSQHLYITSDDEIKEGDWCINENNNIFQYIGGLLLPTDKKIIATTDTSLNGGIQKGKIYNIYAKNTKYEHYDIPQPSQQFITKYIEEYNKGNIITDVLVQYEYIPFSPVAPNRERYSRLKINPDNTINIKPLKDSYTREDFEELLLQFAKDCESNEDLICHYDGDYKDLKQWIKENL